MTLTTQNPSPRKEPANETCGAKMAFGPASQKPATEQFRDILNTGTDREGKYLTFTLDEEEYGIGILKIKEIIGMMPITSVPQTPQFVKGVINLRGKVIPVVDLRLRFAMASMDYNDRTCIIVVETGGRGTDIVIGIVVDSVSEVLNIKNDDIEEPPTFGTTLNTDYILGMAKMEGKVKILLDIDEVLGKEDIQQLSEVS